jgi:hypothetical protein
MSERSVCKIVVQSDLFDAIFLVSDGAPVNGRGHREGWSYRAERW